MRTFYYYLSIAVLLISETNIFASWFLYTFSFHSLYFILFFSLDESVTSPLLALFHIRLFISYFKVYEEEIKIKNLKKNKNLENETSVLQKQKQKEKRKKFI